MNFIYNFTAILASKISGRCLFSKHPWSKFRLQRKKWFTTQIGIGYLIMSLSELPKNYKQPPFVLMYSIGAYLPIR